MTTKDEAIVLLRDADEHDAAETLITWMNRKRGDGGWDLWFRNAYPHLVSLLWPNK